MSGGGRRRETAVTVSLLGVVVAVLVGAAALAPSGGHGGAAVDDVPAAHAGDAAAGPDVAVDGGAAQHDPGPGHAPTDDGAELLEDMSGHDHGDLSVGVLLDDERAHVGAVVRPGQPVTVYNSSDGDVRLATDDGAVDLVVPARTFLTFPAPPVGDHAFTTDHDPAFRGVLVVRDRP